MAYPGDPFSDETIPENYLKASPAIPNLKDSQRLISKYADNFSVVNNKVIPKDFYDKAIEINTERSKTHFQGIIRHPFSNIIYLSGSDRRSNASQLFVLEASTHLESAKSQLKNQLKKGPLGSNMVDGKPDAANDKIHKIYQISTKFWHGGGMDVEGEILVIPLENSSINESKVSFYCIKDPLNPLPFKGADIDRDDEIAGAAALIRLKNGKYLCGVWIDSDVKGHRLDLYVSVSNDLADGFGPSPNKPHHSLKWENKKEWIGVRKQRNFQTFQFLRDKSGEIYCFATDNKFKTSPALPGLNRAHLLRLEIDEDALTGNNPKFVNPRIVQFPEMKINNVRMRYNFAAGGSFYITPEKKLALYSVSHWRNSQDCISMGEFYPPLEDTKKTINDLSLARIELYDDKNFGLNPRGFYMQRCLKIIGGYNNVLEDFNVIKVQGEKFSDKVNSIKMILPKGFSLWLYEHEQFKGKKFEIKGTGKFENIPDLKKRCKDEGKPNVGGKVSSLEVIKN